MGAGVWPQSHGRPRVGDWRCFVADGGGKDPGGQGKRVSRGPEVGGQVDSDLEQQCRLWL